MAQALGDWLAALGYIDEAEATALLYALAIRDATDSAVHSHRFKLPSHHASIANVSITPRGRAMALAWEAKPASPTPGQEASVSQRELAWLLAELLLREPVALELRKHTSAQEILARLDKQWRQQYARPLMEQCSDFIRTGLNSAEAVTPLQAELNLRHLARTCRRDLPQRSVGRGLEILLDALDVPALQGELLTVLRILLLPGEGLRPLRYLWSRSRPGRWLIYTRTALVTVLLVLLANLPGCLRELDQSVRTSWFLWRKPPASAIDVPAPALVLLEDWRSTEYDRGRLLAVLKKTLSYQPAAVGIDVQLFDSYPPYDKELQGILAAHPEVVLVGQHTPYGLKPPPASITGLAFDPTASANVRVASDLIGFAPSWHKYNGADDYQLYYHQGSELRWSLAELTYLTALKLQAGQDVALDDVSPRHARMPLNYLCSFEDLQKRDAVLMEDLLVAADDSSAAGQALAPLAQLALSRNVVLIGVDALDQDRHATPFDKLRGNANGVPGVVLHYFALTALLDPTLRLRGMDHTAWPLTAVVFLLALIAIRLLRYYHPLLAVATVAGYYLVCVAALCWLRYYLPWQPVALTLLATYPALCLSAAASRHKEVRRLCEL